MNSENPSGDEHVDSFEGHGAISGKMISPAFHTGAKKACVVVDYYTDDHRSVVSIKAQTATGLVTATAERTETAVLHDESGPILVCY